MWRFTTKETTIQYPILKIGRFTQKTAQGYIIHDIYAIGPPVARLFIKLYMYKVVIFVCYSCSASKCRHPLFPGSNIPPFQYS